MLNHNGNSIQINANMPSISEKAFEILKFWEFWENKNNFVRLTNGRVLSVKASKRFVYAIVSIPDMLW